MSARDDILAAVRAHAPTLDRPAPAMPLRADDRSAGSVAEFKANLERMGGKLLEIVDGDLRATLRSHFADAQSGIICSQATEVAGDRRIGPETQPGDLADVGIGVVRAAFAVAETGSVCLTDTALGVNTLGYLPQHLVILLDPTEIVTDIHAAYRRPEWRSGHYAVFQTGPSATADIEGVLIHGAQGVRSLSVVLLGRAANRP